MKNDILHVRHREGESSIKIEKTATPAIEAGKYISDLLSHHIGRPVLLLVAGGSASAVYEYIKPQYLSPDLTVTVTDDRFSEDLDINNFALLQATSFYNSLIEADAFCINTEPSGGESLEENRARFEKNIREWKLDFPKGIIIGLYGMGPDGHTAGMIPGLYNEEEFDREFNNSDRLVGIFDAVTAGKSDLYPFPQRISTTIPFMQHFVDHAVYYISGSEKAPALARALDGNEAYYITPATVITKMKDVIVFTDITTI